MKFIKKINPVTISFVIIVLLIININKNLSYWERDNEIITYDVAYYYAYLPAAFIYKDISLNFTDTLPDNIKKKIHGATTVTGKKCIKTSMGLSILYTPFFVLGHISALLGNYPVNGYSLPYKLFLVISSIFYFIIGLFFLKKVLLNYFSKATTIITLIVIVFGTNLLYYLTHSAVMVHSYNFSLIAVFVYLVQQWYKNPNYSNSLLMGLLGGLLVLIRPTNVLVLIFFVLYGINNIRNLKERAIYFIKSYKKVLLMIVSFIIIWIPQFLYWNYVSGKWIYFSYGENESFFFTNPQIINGLFSYRNGWLVYAPVMIFSLIGLFFLRAKLKLFFIPVTIYFIVFIYVTFSWWCWWYVGFGNRAMIDTYSILAIPLAAFIEWFIKKKKLWLFLNIIVFVGFIYLNIFQIRQYINGVIHYEAMTKNAYRDSFGKSQINYKKRIYFEHPHKQLAQRGIQAIDKKYRNGKYCYVIDSTKPYSMGKSFEYNKLSNFDSLCLKLSINVMPPSKPKENALCLVAFLSHNGKIYQYEHLNINDLDLKLNEWNYVEYQVNFNNPKSKNDLVRFFLKHKGDDFIFVDKLNYEVVGN